MSIWRAYPSQAFTESRLWQASLYQADTSCRDFQPSADRYLRGYCRGLEFYHQVLI